MKISHLAILGVGRCSCPLAHRARLSSTNSPMTTAAQDDFEFVELYNSGSTAVDIGGWFLGGRDAAGTNAAVMIPLGQRSPPGATTCWKFRRSECEPGSCVRLPGERCRADRALEWSSGSSTLIDGVVYESNKDPQAQEPYGTLSSAMSPRWAGLLGQFSIGHINDKAPRARARADPVSQSRYVSGRDSNINGRDFGLRRATPELRIAPRSARFTPGRT